MNPKLFLLIVSSALTCLALACATPSVGDQKKTAIAAAATSTPPSPAPTPAVDYAAIADKLVGQCAGITEGDIVEVNGGHSDVELMEEIAIAVRKRGAFALLRYNNPRLGRRMFDEVPVKYDAQTNQLDLKLAPLFTASIGIGSQENQGLFADVPVEKLNERSAVARKANAPLFEYLLRHPKPSVQLGGNGLFPNAQNASQLGLPQPALAKIFWDGVNTDYAKLQADGETYRQLLAATKEAHLTHTNGTDFKVNIAARPVYVSDGVISAEDRKRGGAATVVYLPAGEVYVTPVVGTAEGRIVVDRSFNEGKEVEGLTLDFKAGKLVAMTARSDIRRIKAAYDGAPAGKELFSVLDLGINKSLSLGPQARRGDYAPAGMVSVGLGGNVGYGGENKTMYGYELNLPGCTLKLDGKTVVENGVLK
jgi:aminopeptidase